jgi:hypothetical protein
MTNSATLLLSNEQNPEECDATDDDSSATAWLINLQFSS